MKQNEDFECDTTDCFHNLRGSRWIREKGVAHSVAFSLDDEYHSLELIFINSAKIFTAIGRCTLLPIFHKNTADLNKVLSDYLYTRTQSAYPGQDFQHKMREKELWWRITLTVRVGEFQEIIQVDRSKCLFEYRLELPIQIFQPQSVQ